MLALKKCLPPPRFHPPPTPVSQKSLDPGVPNTSKQEAKSEVAHKWVDWLHNPRHMGAPQRLRAGDQIRNGPQVGALAASPAI